MRQEIIGVYSFDELSESAKETAREWFRESDCWGWSEEWWQSAQAFSRIAPIDITKADYSRRDVAIRWNGISYVNRFDHDDSIRELSGFRAWKWLNNNGWFEWAAKESQGAYSMTGYCGDAPFGDALMAYAINPARVPTIEQVFYECAQEWVNQAADDMEYSYSDEAIDESIRINEYEFTADGRIH